MEDLGDDLPAAIELHEGQQVGEEARADGALDPRKRGDRAGELDRDDAVGARLALAGGGAAPVRWGVWNWSQKKKNTSTKMKGFAASGGEEKKWSAGGKKLFSRAAWC